MKIKLIIALVVIIIAAIAAGVFFSKPKYQVLVQEEDSTPSQPFNEIRSELTIDTVSIPTVSQDSAEVIIRGSYPDDCSTIKRTKQTKTDDGYVIILEAVRSRDECDDALVPFEEYVSIIEPAGFAAGTHTVDVHGVVGTFRVAVQQ